MGKTVHLNLESSTKVLRDSQDILQASLLGLVRLLLSTCLSWFIVSCTSFGLIPWGRSKRLRYPSHGLSKAGEREAPVSPLDLGPFMERHHVVYSPSSLETEERKRDQILAERIEVRPYGKT